MYYVVYGLLYVVSLLPLRILYLFSDLAYVIVYRMNGYRKDIVMANLAIAFPEKSLEEREGIARQFYHNFLDTFIESIKMISMSKKELIRRSDCEFEYINGLIAKGVNIHIMAGHQFNWEFANLVYAMYLKTPFVGIYAPIGNKVLDRIFFNIRKRYGTILISTKEFKNKMHNFFSSQYILALAADQNPGLASKAYWLTFFGKPAPFVKGPARGAVKHNTAILYVGFEKPKRGHYRFRIYPVVENGADYTPEQLTFIYKNLLEETIRKNPANYLWSHRRWRHEWLPEYGEIMTSYPSRESSEDAGKI